MLKSIQSKALEKFNIQMRRRAPGVSIASYHLCSMYINCIVVLEPLSEPNCRLLMYSLIDDKSQLFGNDSRILLRMSVRETGLKSESTSKAGEHFSMGVMLTLPQTE